MALEIEHKYLVVDASYREMATGKVEIRQGYLSRAASCVVRVRIFGDCAFITVKGKTAGDTRLEYEYSIPADDAREMLTLCSGNIIAKTRYIVPYEGFTWEVDEFAGHHEGLAIAEIELPSSDTHYQRPPFVGENVTGNPRYYNSNL